MAWHVVGTVGRTEADFLADLAGKPRRSLRTVAQDEMRRRTRPNPAPAGLREHFQHNDVGRVISYSEGNHPLGQRRPDPGPSREKQADQDCRCELAQSTSLCPGDFHPTRGILSYKVAALRR